MQTELCFPTLRAANAFVTEHHRHSKPVRGHRLSLGLEHEGVLVGVAIIGRPVAQALQELRTAEVLRVCVPELPRVGEHANGLCSKLYAACWRVWRVGGNRLITYALESESGASLRAAGFVRTDPVQERPEGWDRPGRPREVDPVCAEPKWRWEINRHV